MNIVTGQADIFDKTSKSKKWIYREILPDSSVGIESACHAGDHGFISGSGRSTGHLRMYQKDLPGGSVDKK